MALQASRNIGSHAIWRWTVVARVIVVGNVAVVCEADFGCNMHITVVARVAMIIVIVNLVVVVVDGVWHFDGAS